MLNTETNQTASRTSNGGWAGLGWLRQANEARPELALSVSGSSSPLSIEAQMEDTAVPVWLGANLVDKVLMPFDFSAASVRLLAAMASLAERSGLKVSVLHVISPRVPPLTGGGRHGYDANPDRLDTARSLLNSVLRSVARGATDISAHVVIGKASDEIVHYARMGRLGLIAMPAPAHRKFQNLLRFTTTEKVARRACCPVLSVPESLLTRHANLGSDMLGSCSRIVVPTDFSSNSTAALRLAAVLARSQGSKVYVLNFPGIQSPDKVEARDRLESWVSTTLESTEQIQTVVCEGSPSVYMLVRQAELLKADLIVLGTRGYAWAERFRLNSTTDGILRHASCPVLSLRAGTMLAGW